MQDQQINPGDEFEITIDRIIPRGLGIGFANDTTFMVPLTVAGDRVRVRVEQFKGTVAAAELIEVIEPAADRVDPICRYFGSCGGCDFQQMDYTAQLRAKRSMIEDCLRRIAKYEPENEIKVIPSSLTIGYRTRAQWHLSRTGREAGYYRRNSRDLIDVDDCPVLTKSLNETLTEIRKGDAYDRLRKGSNQIDSAVSDDEVSVTNGHLGFAARELSAEIGGETYRYSADVFFQGNISAIPDLLREALSGAAGKNALDLYCGVGLFSLPMARNFEHVIGVEESTKAIEFAKKNAEVAGLKNLDFRAEGVRHFLRNTTISDLDLVLLDPPRAGTEKETIQALIKLEPSSVSYVGCEPSVLARDLKRFIEAGYKVDSIVAIDMFPHTHHVETIARLSKGK